MKRLVDFSMLVTNEFIKIFLKLGTWIFMLLLVAAIIFITVKSPKKISANTYKIKLEQKVQSEEASITKTENSSKDKNALLDIQKSEYKIDKYAYDNNIMYGMPSLWTVVNNILLLKYAVGIFIIIEAAGIISNEYKEGTIKFLLMKPFKRWEILLSKWVSLVLIYITFIAFCIAASFLIGGIKYGFGEINTYNLFMDGNGTVQKMGMFSYQMPLLLGKSVTDIMALTVAFMISTFIKNSSLATALSLGVLFSGSIIGLYVSKYPWLKYTPFPYMDLTQYMTGMPPLVKGSTLTDAIAIILIYFIIIQGISFFSFSKKDIN